MILKKKKRKKPGKDSERKNLVLRHTGNQPGASSAHIGAMCTEAFCARQQVQWVLLQAVGTEPGLTGPDSYTIWGSILGS